MIDASLSYSYAQCMVRMVLRSTDKRLTLLLLCVMMLTMLLVLFGAEVTYDCYMDVPLTAMGCQDRFKDFNLTAMGCQDSLKDFNLNPSIHLYSCLCLFSSSAQRPPHCGGVPARSWH
jgi:hypothetical protein